MSFSLKLTICFALSVLSTPHASRDHFQCPSAHCADARYDPETSCHTCEGSQCMFRGCVHNGAFYSTWRPDNCTVCYCHDKKEVCTAIDCAPVECYGYPVVTRPGRCCPECDFNISATECGAVPVATRSLYTSLGDASCQKDVVERACDKRVIVDNNGASFTCQPVYEEVAQSVEDVPGCTDRISSVTYKTVTRCEKRQLSIHEIPQDYDPDPQSCYYYVDPQTSGGSTTVPTKPEKPPKPEKPEGSKSEGPLISNLPKLKD